jgi:hypothetical protein
MNLMIMQQKVKEYVEGRLRNRSFGLGSLSEEEFKTAMDVIVEELTAAWVAGFMDRSSEDVKKAN